MLFSLLPAGGEETASSRLRVFTLYRALLRMGKQVTLEPSPDTEVLFIQKRVTPEILDYACQIKSKGGLVLYDVDDLGPALDYWVPRSLFEAVVTLADAVTTDTRGHRDLLRSSYGACRVEIIPDPIDYYPTGPVRLPFQSGEPLRILWFGSLSNIALFEKYAHALAEIPDTEVLVATGIEGMERYANLYPSIRFVPWSRPSFIPVLQSCHLTCLMHDGTVEDLAKSNNKMIASINWGVPAVVSGTPDYERTAQEAGVEYAVFSDRDSLRHAVETLRYPEGRRVYLDSAQPAVWNRYAPLTIAQQFLTMVVNLRGSSTVVSSPSTEKERDYRWAWMDPAGHAYRMRVFERQRKGGAKPLISNPSIEEIRSALRAHDPRRVLEVGCGWGRIMEELLGDFEIEGCDVSVDMLQECSPELSVFLYDVAVENQAFLRANTNRWDILFTRGVMLYLMQNPIHMAYAMNNMLMLAKKKIIIWEWPEVCERMQQISTSPKFEYHPIEHRSE